MLVAFVSEAIRLRPAQLPARGYLRDGCGRGLIGQVTAPWQLYLANALLAFGWAGTSLGIITNTLGLWFEPEPERIGDDTEAGAGPAEGEHGIGR